MDNPFRGRGASVPILIESNRIAIPGSESTRIEIFRNRNRKDRNRIGFRFLLSYQSISHQLSFFVVVEIQVNVGRSRKCSLRVHPSDGLLLGMHRDRESRVRCFSVSVILGRESRVREFFSSLSLGILRLKQHHRYLF